MFRIITIAVFILLLCLACEDPTGKGKLVSDLVGEWTKVEERTELDTLYLGIDGSTLNCGVPFLQRDTLSIEIECQYTRLRAAVDPDCCSTVFTIYENGHLEIADSTMFYIVADSLIIGSCEWCQDPVPSREVDVSTGLLRLPCCVENDTIFRTGEGAVGGREPYWYK